MPHFLSVFGISDTKKRRTGTNPSARLHLIIPHCNTRMQSGNTMQYRMDSGFPQFPIIMHMHMLPIIMVFIADLLSPALPDF